MTSQKKPAVPWTMEEIEVFLSLLGDERVQNALDGSRRNESVYREIAVKMAQHGFKRTWLQCREKQKKMKCEYHREKTLLSTSGYDRKVSRWYVKMDAIYGSRPFSYSREADLDTTSVLGTDSATDGLSRCEDNKPFPGTSPVPGTSTASAMVEPSPSPRPNPAETDEPAREPVRRSLSLSQLSGKRKKTRDPPGLAAILQQIHQHNKENDRRRLEQRERKLQLLQALADREAEQAAVTRARAAQMDDKFLAVLQTIAHALSPTQAPSSKPFHMASQKKPAVPWTIEEVDVFLSVLGDERVQNALDGSRRTKSVYREISAKMAQHGFQRTWLQCREKQKKMKSEYYREKSLLSTCGYDRKVSRWYVRMDAIYGNRPSSFGREEDLDTSSSFLQSTLLES